MYERLNEIELREDENQDHFETTALFKIFEIYAKGCGSVQIDEQRAVEYLFQAIERGYWSALFHWLIKLYDEEKIDIEVYGHKLIDYFLKYAQESCSQINDSLAFFPEQKIAKTFNTVAEIYSDLGDAPKALEYFLKADEYGDEQSHIEIARIYREGMGTLKPDGHKLIEFLTKKFTKSKENCAINSSILYEIAEIYEEGCGSIKPNIKKALKFYREAAELFETFAEERLVELTGEV